MKPSQVALEHQKMLSWQSFVGIFLAYQGRKPVGLDFPSLKETLDLVRRR